MFRRDERKAVRKCPEGTTDHRQVVKRSGTPANDVTYKLNPEGVTEYPVLFSATPSGLLYPSMQQAGASPLPVVLPPRRGYPAKSASFIWTS